MNAAQLALDSLEKYGDYPAFHFEGREWGSFEHSAYSSRLGAVLREQGIGPGDPVMVVMPNCPEVLACFQAIWRIGAVITPITPQLGVRELAFVMSHSEAKAVITTPELGAKIVEASHEAEGARLLFTIGDDSAERLEDLSPAIETATPIEGLVERADADLAFLLFTSGTTGHPKGVMLSHGNIVSNHTAVSKLKRMEVRSPTLLILPLSHSFGVMIMNLCHIFGNTAVICRKFDVRQVCEAIEKHRIPRFSAVPTMLVHLINFEDRTKYDLSCLEIVNCGSAILPNEVRTEFERLYDCRLLDGYGLSETSPTATSYHSSDTLRPGSVGSPIPGVSVTIQDEAGNVLPQGEQGEICIQGPNVMKGYLKNEEATREALRGGWLHSGDIGYLDEDGYLYLCDRIKDLIIKGGENISPREIEEALYEHPAVNEVVVVGVKDATYGENIVAVVALKEGEAASETDLATHAAKSVTKYKLPALIVFRDELPKNPNGKLDRKKLRAELADALVNAQ